MTGSLIRCGHWEKQVLEKEIGLNIKINRIFVKQSLSN
jgi:hypothetical protein